MTKIDLTQHPPFIYPDYRSSRTRGPKKPLLKLCDMFEEEPHTQLGEFQGSLSNKFHIPEGSNNLLINGAQSGAPLGERIVVSGQVLNQWGKPQSGILVEIWQANASGRYMHKTDKQDAPLDHNFSGVGRCVTDSDGRYRFYTIKPGAYPWKNHFNAWRPRHIHFSIIGESLADRLVTQMYFCGDPLIEHDPIFCATPAANRHRLISSFDLGITEADFALGYNFDIVLPGTKDMPIYPKESEHPNEGS